MIVPGVMVVVARSEGALKIHLLYKDFSIRGF